MANNENADGAHKKCNCWQSKNMVGDVPDGKWVSWKLLMMIPDYNTNSASVSYTRRIVQQ